ncbi:TVP38/TMEM64 family protein [Bacillus massiliglaciei]|uniref:TVP38/TMEM64 family protein n=1 Tax=Bacillus massiliglaciei TaxID=1816693 RepID=UPI000DA62AB7|nr:VTT domain-containing protein [Bacillus massiliglaciei]
MNEKLTVVMSFLHNDSIYSPLIFISFHILRQFIFIPVAVVCIAGGVLFGAVPGTIYSLLGLTISSLMFYAIASKLPKTKEKLLLLKKKFFGERMLNLWQISILRLIPFIHFHLLNLCILELKKNVKAYTYASFLSNILLAFIYTVFGHYLSDLSQTAIIIILISLMLAVFFMREKQEVFQWKRFFRFKDKGRS